MRGPFIQPIFVREAAGHFKTEALERYPDLPRDLDDKRREMLMGLGVFRLMDILGESVVSEGAGAYGMNVWRENAPPVHFQGTYDGTGLPKGFSCLADEILSVKRAAEAWRFLGAAGIQEAGPRYRAGACR